MTLGFETTTDDVIAGLDRSGTVAVITGGSTGIGLETARALASIGTTVVLAGRNAEKHRGAIDKIHERHPDAAVSHVELDLTSLASARDAAAAIGETHSSINLLINNAGVMYTPFERTADGFELQFGTNHLGHFVFTNHLLSSVTAGAPARIVNLSSGGHGSSDVIWDDPNYHSRPYDKFESYGQAKTANILFTVELERRLAARGVQSYAVHPGMIVTELGRYMTRDDMKLLRSRIAASAASSGAPSTYKTIEQGAATTVWAATAAELDGHGGTYLADCAICSTHAPYARDPNNARRLWSMSEELVGETFPDPSEAYA
jgi:NAD(P)-dependent dehydrogenase (short-subunit alcohol dehydrogenase family)